MKKNILTESEPELNILPKPEPNILSELNTLLTDLNVPFETGLYGGVPPDEYCVIVPLSDSFELFGGDMPSNEIQEARLSIYCKKNYYPLRNRLTKALLKSDFTITDRRYIGYESDTKYHHYAIEVAKNYTYETEE